MRAAIYHFTNVSDTRPKIYKDQLTKLEEFSTFLGYTDVEIFCDKSLAVHKHSEFDRFMSCADQFDALIAKDFYHISKNTNKCITTMKQLEKRNISVYTLDYGCFKWEKAPFDKPLKAATYCGHFGKADSIREILPVHNDILTLFAEKKTNWTILDQYFDESEFQKDSEQDQLKELLKNKDKYDLLLVHSLNNLHWRTANFCKIREQLQLDIYSLQEGFLPYNKENNI